MVHHLHCRLKRFASSCRQLNISDLGCIFFVKNDFGIFPAEPNCFRHRKKGLEFFDNFLDSDAAPLDSGTIEFALAQLEGGGNGV